MREMVPEDIEAAAAALFSAETTGEQIGLLSMQHPGMTLEDAYAVQAAYVARRREAGRMPCGWKVGLTSKPTQDALRTDTPNRGVLFDDMGFAPGAEIPQGRFSQPRVEAELAFVMKSDLSGHVTREQVLAATDHVCPALEIIDARIMRFDPTHGAFRKIVDSVSDNAASGGFVLGTSCHAPDAHDLRRVGVILTRNGIVEETGLGASVLGDPLAAMIWLVADLARGGSGLKAGDIVLSGSFARAVEAVTDDRFEADFGDFGQVSIHFT